MVDINPFQGPIPGESLTRPPGGAQYEAPPQFVDPNQALEYLFDMLVRPDVGTKIVTLLKTGIPAEQIARMLLFQGFMTGKWTPDVALLIARPVLGMIISLGQRKGVSMQVMNKRPKEEDFFKQAVGLMEAGKKPLIDDKAASEVPVETEQFKGLLGQI